MAELLSASDIADRLGGLEGWAGDPDGISRTVKLPTFLTAIAVVDRVAAVAEEMDHHPDIDIRWRNVRIALTTHDAGGLTDLDFDLATEIEACLT
jgi:4a-hydroxytetrahydrobiopterin dehydratase